MIHDVAIIGSGPAGAALAYGLRAQGKRVAVIEKDRWGGTCPNYGCDPTKIMMAAVEAKQRSENLSVAGLHGQLTINWSELMVRKNAFTKPFSARSMSGLKGSGVDTYVGQASFNADGTISVASDKIEAEKVVIATGQKPRLLDIDGKEFLKTSNDFLDLTRLPERIVFLGAGYVSLELAQIAAAAGSDVTIITHGSLKVKAFDAELGQDFLHQLADEGLTFIENVSVTKIQQTAEGYQLTDGRGFEQQADLVIAGVGRVPVVEELNLQAVNVKTTRAGIVVNDVLQTSNPAIYAIGDVIDKPQAKLTPVSGYEARYLTKNLFAEKVEAIHYPEFPTLIFGATKLAKIGQTEGASKTIDMTSWYSYKRIADPKAKIKVTLDQGLIIGATVLSTVADELVNFLNLVIAKGLTLEEVQGQLMAYPTIASDLQYLY